MTEPAVTTTPAPDATLGAWLKSPGARRYLAIFGWLVVLTVIEVGATQMHLAKATLATFLILTALVKATLVALYFMHLRHEVRLILAMIVIPLLIAAFFVAGVFPDIVIAARENLR
jgi:cytochrome c oxidase subunit 4